MDTDVFVKWVAQFDSTYADIQSAYRASGDLVTADTLEAYNSYLRVYHQEVKDMLRWLRDDSAKVKEMAKESLEMAEESLEMNTATSKRIDDFILIRDTEQILAEAQSTDACPACGWPDDTLEA